MLLAINLENTFRLGLIRAFCRKNEKNAKNLAEKKEKMPLVMDEVVAKLANLNCNNIPELKISAFQNMKTSERKIKV